MLDDGRLTDNQGHTVDFTNTIIVMTSNIGSQAIQEISKEGGNEQDVREAVMMALQSRFLPEFLNRVDEIILFHPLSTAHIREIVLLQLRRLRQQLQEKGIELAVTDAAVDAIAAQGYNPVYGARPLKRVIQQQIQNPLAVELLKQRLPEGSQVRVDFADEQFSFERLAARPPQ